ncbi:MAG: hypothetical protein IKD18_00105 [Clostridia bacterium]|nr:hypothetical protein [Clostridia bacterium]
MNKLQIKAEILATLRVLLSSEVPDPSLLGDLKNITDKKTVMDILIRELLNADEHKSLLVCWLLSELIEKETLNDELWNVIKSPEHNDHIKMIAFNMLKDLGNKIDYEVISEYFEKFNELINKETKELLDSLAEHFGVCERQFQLRELERAIRLLEENGLKSRGECQNKIKILHITGLTAGLALLILLI